MLMNYRIAAPVALLVIVAAITSCSKLTELQESNLNASKKQTLYNVGYGNHSRHKMDIALPKSRTENTPVVIFIHGGAWVLGDKGVFNTEIQRFADSGFACATINYRYASESSGVHHPELPKDIRQAVDFIASKSAKWKVSPQRFGLVGHSAGGHLSLLTAYTFNVDGKIKACSSWAGPVDFLDSAQLAINGAKDVFKAYTGKALANLSDTLLYQSASPFWVVTAASVPTHLIYATSDEVVPYTSGLKLQQRLQALGVEHIFTTQQNATHVWTGSHLENARNTTLQWFKAKL